MKPSFVFFFLCVFCNLFSQNYPVGYFRMPVDTIVSLSGNFGEIRNDHFHYGWDIRTGGKEGLKILAAADGYVSRIKAGTGGYGKVIYVTHPNGYVSVYAHLSSFNPSLSKYVKDVQYTKQTYEVELYPARHELKVKKGELIAFSGNTGYSDAPHLHFEIRDEKTEEIINPYLFGLKINDNVKPVFKTLAIYPKGGVVNKSNTSATYFDLKSKSGILATDSIIVSGAVAFGAEVFDTENNSGGKNQIYSLEFQINGKRIYFFELNRFAFDQTRYVNCHADYAAMKKDKRLIQKAFIEPGNKFVGYKDVVNSGIVSFTNDSTYKGKFIARDYYGNTTILDFNIYAKKQQSISNKLVQISNDVKSYTINYPDSFALNTDYLKMFIPANTFYDSVNLIVKSESKTVFKSEIYSAPISLGNKYIPMHKYITLSLKCDVDVPAHLLNKLLVVSANDKNNMVSEGGDYENGWVTTKTRSLGIYAIAIDTIKPVIKFKSDFKEGVITLLDKIDITIYDNLSGIKSYKVLIDGKWVLFEYEHKKQLLSCKNDDSIPAGKHIITVEVEDNRGNVNTVVKKYVK